MKIHSFILLFLLFISGNLSAQLRSAQELKEMAQSHFSTHSLRKSYSDFSLCEKKTPVLIGSSTSILPHARKESFYIFKEEGDGFVILSADKRMPGILGYSTKSTLQPDSIPDGLRMLLTSYQYTSESLSNNMSENSTQEEQTFVSDILPEEKAPLLDSIAWAQDYPYYNACPEINGTRTVVGCVATAMSTIMAYYKYPLQGKGTISYKWNGQTLQSDLSSHSYRWEKIRGTYPYVNFGNSHTDLFSTEESKEASKLCYDVALSIQTTFGTQASTSINTQQLLINSLVNHFSYDPNIQVLYRDYYSRAEWLQIIKKEIAKKKPVIYRGGETALSGHVFIADGYDREGLIHLDFGWNGMANGYYHLASIVTSGTGIGASGNSGFNLDQYIFVGIEPPTEESSYQSHLIINEDLTPSVLKCSRSDEFSVNSVLVNKGTPFNGTFGVVLYDENDACHPISTPSPLSLNMDYARTFTLDECKIPVSVPPGIYQLRLIAKDYKEKEQAPVRSSSSTAGYCTVQIDNDSIRLVPSSTSITLQKGEIEVEHALYTGLTGDFTLTLTNGKNEFLGTIGIGQKKGNSYIPLAECIGSLQNGETLSYSLQTPINLETGEYTLTPLYKEKNIWKPIGSHEKITIVRKPSEGPENINCAASELPGPEYRVGRHGNLKGTITLTNDGSPYDKGLIFGIFYQDYSNTYNISSYSMPFFIDSGEKKICHFHFPHNLPEGDYKALLYKMTDNGLARITPNNQTSFHFRVVDDSLLSEIESPEIDAKTFTLYYSEGGITIQPLEPIKQWTVFDSNACCIYRQQEIKKDNEFTFPIHSLKRGVYLIHVQLTNGARESTKFIIR